MTNLEASIGTSCSWRWSGEEREGRIDVPRNRRRGTHVLIRCDNDDATQLKLLHVVLTASSSTSPRLPLLPHRNTTPCRQKKSASSSVSNNSVSVLKSPSPNSVQASPSGGTGPPNTKLSARSYKNSPKMSRATTWWAFIHVSVTHQKQQLTRMVQAGSRCKPRRRTPQRT